MIRLEQSTKNNIIVTLNEFTTISNPFYLFEFISDDTNDSKIFTCADISTNVSRYNEFKIILTTNSEDLLNGFIKLPLKGYYTYNIYSQVSATNLDLANITELVEVGKVYVNGLIKPVVTVYNDGIDNKIVYNG
jgi:hypothetical protein